MSKFPSWQFDEMKQVGKDYADKDSWQRTEGFFKEIFQ